MNFKIGEINNLIVERQTDIGYMLTNEYNEEIFMHNKDTTEELNKYDDVDAFVFFDSKKRITATMHKPIILIDEPGFVTVKNVVNDLGVFIENNISKDPLISSDDLPQNILKWPKEGDTIYCKLKNTKTQLIAKLVNPKDVDKYLKQSNKLNLKEKVEAYVIKSGVQGLNLLTKDGHNIFVYYKHKRKDYRIGEVVNVTITKIKDDETYNGTLLETKVPLMEKDAETLLNYINENQGYIPFNTKSDVHEIGKQFKMSKASFKRALSNLYKKRLIEIKEDGTYLVK